MLEEALNFPDEFVFIVSIVQIAFVRVIVNYVFKLCI
jgi:hypothetical protein